MYHIYLDYCISPFSPWLFHLLWMRVIISFDLVRAQGSVMHTCIKCFCLFWFVSLSCKTWLQLSVVFLFRYDSKSELQLLSFFWLLLIITNLNTSLRISFSFLKLCNCCILCHYKAWRRWGSFKDTTQFQNNHESKF